MLLLYETSVFFSLRHDGTEQDIKKTCPDAWGRRLRTRCSGLCFFFLPLPDLMLNIQKQPERHMSDVVRQGFL